MSFRSFPRAGYLIEYNRKIWMSRVTVLRVSKILGKIIEIVWLKMNPFIHCVILVLYLTFSSFAITNFENKSLTTKLLIFHRKQIRLWILFSLSHLWNNFSLKYFNFCWKSQTFNFISHLSPCYFDAHPSSRI